MRTRGIQQEQGGRRESCVTTTKKRFRQQHPQSKSGAMSKVRRRKREVGKSQSEMMEMTARRVRYLQQQVGRCGRGGRGGGQGSTVLRGPTIRAASSVLGHRARPLYEYYLLLSPADGCALLGTATIASSLPPSHLPSPGLGCPFLCATASARAGQATHGIRQGMCKTKET